MRLTTEEITVIKQAIFARDSQAQVYLFGSRTDDLAKGGDIDLLIISQLLTPGDKRKIKSAIFERIEEQKIDILIAKDDSDPFVKIALMTGTSL